ncbi:MAG: hypothetical protein ACE5IE_01565 [Dehalococcoidia bacterium]
MKIGVDVDGVIGNQVPHLLRRVRHKYGIKMKKSDIKLWDQPMGHTNFEKEMEEAVLDRTFVLTMPLIRGAREGLERIASHNRVIIVTSRPPEADEDTIEWLNTKRLGFDEFINTHREGKLRAPIDVLVDDRLENVRDFALSGRMAVMLSQPWNSNHALIVDLLKQGAVINAPNWKGIVHAIEALLSQ